MCAVQREQMDDCSYLMSWNPRHGDLLVVIGSGMINSMPRILKEISRAITPVTSVKALFLAFTSSVLRPWSSEWDRLDVTFEQLEELHVFTNGNNTFSGKYLERASGAWKVLTLELPSDGDQIPVVPDPPSTSVRVEHLYLTAHNDLSWRDDPEKSALDRLVVVSDSVTVLSSCIRDVPFDLKITTEHAPAKARHELQGIDWAGELRIPGTHARVPPLPAAMLLRVARLIGKF